MRSLLTILIPLLLPTLLYFGYVWIARRRGGGGAGGQPTRDIPWLWLGGAGVLLLAVTLLATALFGGAMPGSRYEPPQLIDGQVRPGEFSNGT